MTEIIINSICCKIAYHKKFQYGKTKTDLTLGVISDHKKDTEHLSAF